MIGLADTMAHIGGVLGYSESLNDLGIMAHGGGHLGGRVVGRLRDPRRTVHLWSKGGNMLQGCTDFCCHGTGSFGAEAGTRLIRDDGFWRARGLLSRRNRCGPEI